MSASLRQWLSSHPSIVASIAVPLVSVGLAAAATSWKLGRPKPRLAFASDGVTRPLSELEAWYSSKNLALTACNLSIVALLKGTPWTEKEAQILISRVMARHPASLCSIVDKDDGIQAPYWKRLWHHSYSPEEQGIIDIQFETRTTEAENDDCWQDFTRKHETAGFSSQNTRHTLFKVIIVSRPSCPYWELIFVAHHAVFDGRGASNFVRQLLEEWAEFQAEEASNPQIVDLANIKIIEEVSSTENHVDRIDGEVVWYAPLENRIRTMPGLWYLISEVLQDRFAFLRPKINIWVGPEDRGVLLKPTQETKWLKISAETVAALRPLCRQKGTSVNGALWAATVFGLLTAYRRAIRAGKETQTGDGGDAAKSVVLALQGAVDMRPRLGIAESHLGPMVTGTTINTRASIQDKFWETAKKVNDEVIDAIPEALLQNGLSNFVPKPAVPWFYEREARKPNGRSDTVSQSNLGMRDFEDNYGACQFRDLWFTQYGMRSQQLFSMFVVTPGKDRDMNVMLSGVANLIGHGDLQSFADTFLQSLQHATKALVSDDFTYLDLNCE